MKSFNAGYFFSLAAKIFKTVSPKALKAFSSVLGLLMISSVLGVIRDSTAREELKGILTYISAVCVCGAAYSVMSGLIGAVSEFVSVAGKFLRYIIPVMGTISAAGGAVTFSTVCGGLLYAAVALMETLCEGFLLPLVRVCLCISMGAAMLGNDALAGIVAPLKKFIAFILGFIMLILSAVLGFQSIITKSADSALLRSVKFTAANIIPIVGGAVGEAMSTLSSSISTLKSTLGGAGAAIIIIIVLSPLCMLAAYKIMFGLVSAAAGLLGLSRECKFLSEMGSVAGFLMAVISCIAVFFIIALAVFAATGNG